MSSLVERLTSSVATWGLVLGRDSLRSHWIFGRSRHQQAIDFTAPRHYSTCSVHKVSLCWHWWWSPISALPCGRNPCRSDTWRVGRTHWPKYCSVMMRNLFALQCFGWRLPIGCHPWPEVDCFRHLYYSLRNSCNTVLILATKLFYIRRTSLIVFNMILYLVHSNLRTEYTKATRNPAAWKQWATFLDIRPNLSIWRRHQGRQSLSYGNVEINLVISKV